MKIETVQPCACCMTKKLREENNTIVRWSVKDKQCDDKDGAAMKMLYGGK